MGARSLPLHLTAGHILAQLAKLAPGSLILLRRPKTYGVLPGQFEVLTAKLGALLSLEVEWHQPDGIERGQTYLRDVAMVEKADYVVAFFSADAIMVGGTGHVVETALSKLRAVEAYTVDDEGVLVYVGTYDPISDVT